LTKRIRRAAAKHAARLRAALGRAAPAAAVVSIVAALWSVAAAAPAGGTSSQAVLPLTPSVPLTSAAFRGTPAVGALFTTSAGKLGAHFCTASVVHSAAGNLLVTAAHCVSSYSSTSPADLAFVPGYDDGAAPYGVWAVTRIFVDADWVSTADPDDDVAFLVVSQGGASTRIEDLTGAEHLGISRATAGVDRVIGYPGNRNKPVSCQNRLIALSPTQLQFNCANFTDGTSGGPFLVSIQPGTGDGTVIGVIGGYQAGGYSPDISYAARFGPNIAALAAAAAAGS